MHRLRCVRSGMHGRKRYSAAAAAQDRGGELQLTFNSQSCFHCVTTRCATVCPTGSILRDTETGIVIHDNAPCIRCGKCVKTCPVGAVSLSEIGVQIAAGKCAGCGECVSLCPKGVLKLTARSGAPTALPQERLNRIYI